jgi:hypothetical protein
MHCLRLLQRHCGRLGLPQRSVFNERDDGGERRRDSPRMRVGNAAGSSTSGGPKVRTITALIVSPLGAAVSDLFSGRAVIEGPVTMPGLGRAANPRNLGLLAQSVIERCYDSFTTPEVNVLTPINYWGGFPSRPGSNQPLDPTGARSVSRGAK